MTEELLKQLKKEYKKSKFSDIDQKVGMLIYEHLMSIKEDETNKIFVYCGATTQSSIIYNPDAANLLYWDIEQPYMISVLSEDYSKFEEENTIIYGNHYDIMLEFFKEAIKSDQEKAKKKIIKKYKK